MLTGVVPEKLLTLKIENRELEQLLKEKEQLLTDKPATQPAIQESIVPEDIQIKVIPENTTEKIEEP